MTQNLVILPGCPKAEKRTPPFQSSSRATLRQRPPGNRRRHKTLARNMDGAILGDQNGRENLVNFFVVKLTIFYLTGEVLRVVFSRTFLGASLPHLHGADCYTVLAGKWFIPLRALICFARSVPLGRLLNSVAFADNSLYSTRALQLYITVLKL